MGKIENRQRCLKCKYYGRNVCPLMAGADVFQIDKCILDYKAIKSIKENSLDSFIFYSNPAEYLSYLSFKDKEHYPKVGSTVLTLTGGFSSVYSGKFLTVDSEDNIQIFLHDNYGQYCVAKADWWRKLFKIQNN